MFEKIHFIENKHYVLTPHNMINEIQASPFDVAQQSVSHAKEQLSHKFNLDGHIRILFPDSDIPEDPEHYFYDLGRIFRRNLYRQQQCGGLWPGADASCLLAGGADSHL